jgi:hypothetical protein
MIPLRNEMLDVWKHDYLRSRFDVPIPASDEDYPRRRRIVLVKQAPYSIPIANPAKLDTFHRTLVLRDKAKASDPNANPDIRERKIRLQLASELDGTTRSSRDADFRCRRLRLLAASTDGAARPADSSDLDFRQRRLRSAERELA